MNFLFHFSALIVLPFWLPMIFFPRSQKTKRLVSSPWIILPPTLCYLALLLPNLAEAMTIFRNPSPQSLAKMMSAPWAASLFWAYAGAFDLFVGRWIYLDADERGISSWFISPILFVCVLFGPLGFSLYAVTRMFYRDRHDQR